MKFSEPLRLDHIGDRTYRLVVDFSCELDDGRIIVVPASFITDFASTPRFCWSLFPPDGRHGKAAVVHDVLYKTNGFNNLYSRKEADLIFLNGMEILGVPKLMRRTMYRAVRIWSWQYWDKSPDQKSTSPDIFTTVRPYILQSGRTERVLSK